MRAMPCSTPKLMKLFGNIHHEPALTSTAHTATCAQRRQKRGQRWPCDTASAWPRPAQNKNSETMQARCHVHTGSV